jgi:hypothetical protein
MDVSEESRRKKHKVCGGWQQRVGAQVQRRYVRE